MRVMVLVAMTACAACGAGAAGAAGAERYAFYRSMRGGARGPRRRMFGGRAAPLAEWGAVCALLDRFWAATCSGAVLAPRWALTAAHCVTPRLAYVEYNTRSLLAAEGDAVPVHHLYRHPGYKVVQRDEGRGVDVTTLHDDVGLVRVRADMLLRAPPPRPVMDSLRLYDAGELVDEPVEVLGFGRTESAARGERLYAARLVVARCGRGAWRHVACGAGAAGVCAGDSGGPVVYRGAQVALVSLGPVACAGPPPGPPPGPPLASVFTALYRYAAVINATVTEAERALRMTRLPRGASSPAGPRPFSLLSLCGSYLLVVTFRGPPA